MTRVAFIRHARAMSHRKATVLGGQSARPSSDKIVRQLSVSAKSWWRRCSESPQWFSTDCHFYIAAAQFTAHPHIAPAVSKKTADIQSVILEGEERKNSLVSPVLLSRIPAFPPVVLRVLDLLSNDSTPMPELVREVTADATLSAQVLRLANSPLFGFKSQIDTVQHAMAVLGLARIQSLVMTVATSNYMRAALRTDALVKCWRHSLAVAFISRELARGGGLQPDGAYTQGLLHDIGRLGLLVGYPDEYNELLAQADRDSVSLLDLEQRRFGMDHCEVGRILTGQWGLPEEFCVVTGRHHDPPQGGPFDMLRIVHLSCRLADSLGFCAVAPLKPIAFEEFQALLPPSVRERVPATADDFLRFVESSMGESQAEVDQAAADSDPDFGRGSATRNPRPEAEGAAAAAEGLTAPAMTQIAWDFTIVLITVAIFVSVMAVCWYLQTG